MATADKTKRPEGHARAQAREVIQREAQQRELQAKQRQIEVLRNFATAQFNKLNRSIVSSLIWMIVLGCLFLAAGWYAQDVFTWAMEKAGYETPAKKADPKNEPK